MHALLLRPPMLVLYLLLPACAGTAERPIVAQVRQGIGGTVRFFEGDFMPGTGPARGTITPVRRELRVHRAASQDSVESAGPGPFFRRVLTPLAGKVWSDSTGVFLIALPPGVYSVFVVEDSLLYANMFDGQGTVFPVTVFPDSVTRILVDITSKATF